MVCSLIFSNFLALAKITDLIVKYIISMGMGPYTALWMAIIILLIAGCIMPATPMILLFTPVFYSIFVRSFGFDGIWFGVLITVLVEIALITPPVGMNLFAFESMIKGKITKTEEDQGVIPFVIADLIRVGIIVAFPAIAIWLPQQMFGS
jgi:TRAP-type C4-dicarboxylate transport system permease large subunit